MKDDFHDDGHAAGQSRKDDSSDDENAIRQSLKDQLYTRRISKFFSAESSPRKWLPSIAKLKLAIRRFPVSILLLVALAIPVVFVVCDDILPDDILPIDEILHRFCIFASIGAIIGVAAALWLEDRFDYKGQYFITAAVVSLWGVYCFFLPADGYEALLKSLPLGAVAALSVFFISFLKEGSDKAFGKFAAQILFQLGMAVVLWLFTAIFLIIFGGMLSLFIPFIIFLCIIGLNFVLVMPLYFMSNIPDKAAKHDENILPSDVPKYGGLFISIFLLIWFPALLCGEMISKDVINMITDPAEGMLLVSVIAGIGLLAITFSYPARQLELNNFVIRLPIYISVIMLPLLTVMSISYYLSGGRVTASNVYYIIANLWFYGIYAHTIITKAQCLKWIYISAAVLILLTSIGSWGVANIVK